MEASSIMIKVLVLIQIFSSSLSETEVVESFTEADMGSQSMASCSSTSPETYKAENGSTITYCDFNGEKKYPGEKWTSEESENCTCDAKEGLKCCKAGQQHYSYTNVDGNIECVQKKEGNEIKWVNAKTWEPCSPQGKGGKLNRKELNDTLEMEDTGESLDVDDFEDFDEKIPEFDDFMDDSFFDFDDNDKDDDIFDDKFDL